MSILNSNTGFGCSFSSINRINAIPPEWEFPNGRDGNRLNLGNLLKSEVDYNTFVQFLVKPGKTIAKEVTANQDFLWTSSLVLSSQVALIQQNPDYVEMCGFCNRNESSEYKHMITGMIGEMGEIMDIIKSIVLYRKNPITELTKEGKKFTDAWKEEIGDFCFYSIGLEHLFKDGLQPLMKDALDNCYYTLTEIIIPAFNKVIEEFEGSHQDITIEDCIKDNVTKLSKRYHKLSYSDDQAKERADKQ